MCLADGVMLVMLVMLVMVGKVSSIVPCFFWNKKYVNCETHKMVAFPLKYTSVLAVLDWKLRPFSCS